MPFRQTGISGRSQSRIDGIDLLRGLSIFLVLMDRVNTLLLLGHVQYAYGGMTNHRSFDCAALRMTLSLRLRIATEEMLGILQTHLSPLRGRRWGTRFGGCAE
jgi:hypothetical protein